VAGSREPLPRKSSIALTKVRRVRGQPGTNSAGGTLCRNVRSTPLLRELYDKVADNFWRASDAKHPSICEQYRADPESFLGRQRNLLSRERYAVPNEAARVAPYSLDVQVIYGNKSGLRTWRARRSARRP
jgi:hypothetical protein